MSLDISLISKTPIKKQGTGVFIRDNGKNRELTTEEVAAKFPGSEPRPMLSFETNEVFDWNITHNLTMMAERAGLYYALWRPDEKGWKVAADLIPVLEEGIKTLKWNPTAFKKLNPDNGWGSYDGLLECAEAYLKACKKYPAAEIEVDR